MTTANNNQLEKKQKEKKEKKKKKKKKKEIQIYIDQHKKSNNFLQNKLKKNKLTVLHDDDCYEV